MLAHMRAHTHKVKYNPIKFCFVFLKKKISVIRDQPDLCSKFYLELKSVRAT